MDAIFLVYFHEQREKDAGFFEYITIDDGQLTNSFWVAADAIELYRVFNDVDVFDATNSFNYFNLPSGPFVEVDNKGLKIQFGCALVQQETAKTFL